MSDGSELHIRDAGPADAGAIGSLLDDGFASYREWAPPDWQPPVVNASTWPVLAAGPREEERCWVAEAPGSGLAGVAWSSTQSLAIAEVGPDDMILRSLFVAPEWWGSGVAAALLQRVVDAARAAAFQTLWLATPAGATRARAFYERTGFSVREERFEPGLGLDVVVYARPLRERASRRVVDRRFGPGPYVLGFDRDTDRWGNGFPFDVPAVAAIDDLNLDRPVTLLAGDNGTGKSTIVEALAQAIGFGDEGGELERSGELPAVPRPVLGGALSPVLAATKPRRGYFLRAESFFNVAGFVDGGSKFAPDLSLYGDVPLHEQSHGQSFLALAANRFGGEGVYLLDEPEAALSVTGALALLAVVVRAARDGAQFVIATHSPVLLACPESRIYELDGEGLHERAYDDLEAVRLTRSFLEAPARFLRAVLEEE